MTEEVFSAQLERWLTDKRPKTLKRVGEVFGEKSFAPLFILLMIIPALPLPTGGVTHIFEIITLLLALEFMSGRQTPWLPEKWQGKSLGFLAGEKSLPRLLKVVRLVETRARPRLGELIDSRIGRFCTGLAIFLFTLSAFVAPPFSGLDTLPSLGVVVLSIGILFSDFVIVLIGGAVGVAGIALVITLGGAVLKGLHLV